MKIKKTVLLVKCVT